MGDELDVLIRNVERRARAEDPAAMADIIRLTEQYPNEPRVWRTLAYASGRERDYVTAIAAITRAMEILPGDPVTFCNRGEYALMAGDYESAIADFTQGLILCDELNSDYLRQSFHFQRAEAYFQLGRKAEALADLEHVDDDCVSWTVQVRSKADLLALCTDSFTEGGTTPSPVNEDITDESSIVRESGGNLVVDDSSELPEFPDEAELALVAELGADGLAALDATLLQEASHRWRKAARVIGFAAEDFDSRPDIETCFRVLARRLIALVDAGKLEAQGNLAWPRYSEVRFPPSG